MHTITTCIDHRYSEWWDEGRSEGEFAGVLMSLARFGSGVERIASMIREHQEHQSASLLEFLKHYSELTRSLPANLPGFQPPGKGHHGGSVKKSGKEAAKSPATSPTADVDDAEATQIMMAELRYFHERLVHDLQVHSFCIIAAARTNDLFIFSHLVHFVHWSVNKL